MTVPDGWRVAPLGEVADTTLGKMLDRGKTRGPPTVPYLRNVNVQWGRIDTHDLLTMELADEDRARFAVQPGDLLVCEGGEIGRAAIWHGRTEYLAFQKALHRIRSRGNLDMSYLCYLLELYGGDGTLERFATGSTIAHLPQQKLRALPVPFPALDEQRRIVDILEDHLSRLDAATELLESADRRVSGWSRSVVDASLWDDQYPQIRVADLLAVSMRNGHSARAVRDGAAGIRTLTLTAVTRNEFTDEFTKVTSADPDRVKSLWLRSGDVLVQRANTPELVGTTAMFDGPEDWAIYPDLLIRLRANEKRVLCGYLCAAMRSERAHRQMRSKAKGLAGSMPKIDQAAIGSTTVPVPDMETQLRLLLRIGEVQSIRGRTTEAAKAARTRAQGLRRALLSAASSGRLTGRSSDLEVAEELSVSAV